MSQSRDVMYQCPYCGKEFSIVVYDSVNVSEDRDLRERAMSGDLFQHSCPHCHKDFMVQAPLVYIDSDHHFVLWLSQQDITKDLEHVAKPLIAQGYTLRRCATIQEFVEKIQIFEDGLDDIMVELAKYDSFIEFIDNKKGNPEEVTAVEYQRCDNGVMKINIRTDDKGMSFLIPLAVIEEEMEENKSLYQVDETLFPCINADWMISLFQESAGEA